MEARPPIAVAISIITQVLTKMKGTVAQSRITQAKGHPDQQQANAIHRNPAAIILQKGITEHDGH
ncbi:hypothetical protein DPMN_065450 [Dreissena polymorpha]|uniref:Uncharacterized protein n=1 Tax=Dreissena polymorpha TaxID=45954 RepID=A0A9D3YVY1_DREPO|nr:hypothetical protein DPMN_065450 [Dreissena polymorpha]